MGNSPALFKAFVGLIAAVLIYAVFHALGGALYHSPAPSRVAFIADPTAPAEAPVEAPADTPATVDLAAGEAAFKACKACHNADKGGKNGTGPNLWGVFGRPVASVAGFKYSDSLVALAAQSWDQVSLEAFLTKPKDFAKDTKMSFPGMKKPEDRANLIAWLALQSDTPQQLGGAAPAAPATDPAATTSEAPPAEPAEPFADLADDAVVDIAPVAYPEGVTYADVPALTEDELVRIEAAVAKLEAEIPTLDHQRAQYHPIHFPPAIEQASSAECLTCHQEILANNVRQASPAGVTAAESMAWYQTLDTYAQGQSDFHWRHIASDYAQQVMKLECTFCHKGNDPREETPDMMPGRAAFSAEASPEFTLRKMVNPSETCLLCHGAYPAANMGLEGSWHDLRVDMETAEAPNGCLSCRAETFRTNRHQVNYLNAATIEDIARNGTSDSCFGCHGGRQWYRISYPYARTPWPGMDTETVPDWAVDRPTASKPEHQIAP